MRFHWQKTLEAHSWFLLGFAYVPFPFTNVHLYPSAIMNGNWDTDESIFLNLMNPSSKSLKLRVVLGIANTKGMPFLLVDCNSLRLRTISFLYYFNTSQITWKQKNPELGSSCFLPFTLCFIRSICLNYSSFAQWFCLIVCLFVAFCEPFAEEEGPGEIIAVISLFPNYLPSVVIFFF